MPARPAKTKVPYRTRQMTRALKTGRHWVDAMLEAKEKGMLWSTPSELYNKLGYNMPKAFKAETSRLGSTFPGKTKKWYENRALKNLKEWDY